MSRFVSLPVLFGLAALGVQAEVKLPPIFGDHMVLQQEGKIPVWGTADPGENVTVTIGANHAQTTADAQGLWRVDLPSLPTNATAQTLTVAGKNTVTFQDVLIGDVWIGSGQSNMGLRMNDIRGRGPGADDAIAKAGNPQLRVFTVDCVTGIIPKKTLTGSWQVDSPDSAAGFSAIAYFFGRDLQQKLNRPIGMIATSWGGTYIQSWLSLESIKGIPDTDAGVAAVEKRRDAFPTDPAAQAALMAAYQKSADDWQTNVDTPYQATIKKWQADADAAKAAGQPQPPRPNESSNRPISPDGEAGEYTTLFNGMINPLIPYGIKGFIWYQGENNARSNADTGDPSYYQELKAMITDWRARWNQGDFPFLIVGIANFDNRSPQPTDSGWARVREAEEKIAETVPNTAVAQTIDIGEATNIHPGDKQDAGSRLAAAALHVAYGQDVPFAGPTFDSMTVEGSNVRIKFKNIGSGLTIGASPHVTPDNPALSMTDLVGFSLAGADQKWVFATAKLDGNDVVVSSPSVTAPVAVRYGWATNPAVNLYNKEGFPAMPFRTDNGPYAQPTPGP